MTTTINIPPQYKCDICGTVYVDETDAQNCESKPISEDKGVKVGDTVRITAGDGKGETAVVTSVSIIDRDWGHYAWKRYWHTVALTARLKSGFSRTLTFDNYESPT